MDMSKYAVHINKPSFRGFKRSVIVEAASPEAAKSEVEKSHGVGSVVRVIAIPGAKR